MKWARSEACAFHLGSDTTCRLLSFVLGLAACVVLLVMVTMTVRQMFRRYLAKPWIQVGVAVFMLWSDAVNLAITIVFGCILNDAECHIPASASSTFAESMSVLIGNTNVSGPNSAALRRVVKVGAKRCLLGSCLTARFVLRPTSGTCDLC
jgi:hypothetical protein